MTVKAASKFVTGLTNVPMWQANMDCAEDYSLQYQLISHSNSEDQMHETAQMVLTAACVCTGTEHALQEVAGEAQSGSDHATVL